MKRLLHIFSLLLFSFSLTLFAQSATMSHKITGWYKDTSDSPVLDVTVLTRLKGFGYTYVQAKIQSAYITGYYYQGHYYGSNELSAYGIHFPVSAKDFITNISVVAGIRKRGIGTEFHAVHISAVDKLYSHSEVPFSQGIKNAINSYGGSNGADNWETYGSVQDITLLNPSTSNAYEIKSAIRQYIRSKGRTQKKSSRNSTSDYTSTSSSYEENSTYNTETSSYPAQQASYTPPAGNTALRNSNSQRGEAARLNSLGIQAYKAGDYDKAQNYFAQALAILPNDRNILSNFERTKKKKEEDWYARQEEARRRAREEEKRNKREMEELGRKVGALGQVMFDPSRETFEMTRVNYNTGYFNSISIDYAGRYDFAGIYARMGLNYTEPDKLIFKDGRKRFTTDIANISLGLGASLFFGGQGGKGRNWSISGVEITGGFEFGIDNPGEEFKDTLPLFYEYGIGYLWAEGGFGFQLTYLIKSYSVGNFQIRIPGEREYNSEIVFQSLMFSLLF